MKHLNLFLSVFFLASLVFILHSCNYDKCTDTIEYTFYRPVYKTEAQLRDFKIGEAQPLENPGKIYVYGDYLLINEQYKGIHIFDNSNPENPVNLSFISIEGNIDMAVKDNILYAENYLDLVSVDISNPKNPVFVKSIENVFNTYNGVKNKFLIYYVPTDTVKVLNCDNPYYGQFYYWEDSGAYVRNGGGNSWTPPTAPTGIGGSMARFTIIKDRLYTVDDRKLNIFNIFIPDNPVSVNKMNIGRRIETIYPFKNNLFIGSNDGMYIYGLSNPDNPVFISKFRHARSCDPVLPVGDVAYVTLRSGTRCSGYSNQLDVIDIKNIIEPKLIKSYPMSNPHGLAVVDDKMILCEGNYGLKVLDVKDNYKITQKYSIESNHFYDVIGLSEDDIILVGENGLYQYKFDGYKLEELSYIPISKK